MRRPYTRSNLVLVTFSRPLHESKSASPFMDGLSYIIYLADPGKARECSTNSHVITGFIK